MTGINLSKLTKPNLNGVVLSPATIADDMVADLRADGFIIAANAGDPAYRIILAAAQREANLRAQLNDAAQSLSLAYAVAGELDNIGMSFYGVARQVGETDDNYRNRIADTPERFAVGLSGGWYEQNALAVHNVVSARVTTPTPGDVLIYIHAREEDVQTAAGNTTLNAGGVPDADLLAEVKAALTAADVRQQTDRVTVAAGTPVDYRVVVSLQTYAEPDSAIVLAAAKESFAALAAERGVLGEEMNKIIIAGAVIIAGVRDATITIIGAGGAAVESIGGDDNQFLRLTASDITVA